MVVNMSISNASANAVITCHAYLVDETVLTRAAYLTVQGTGRSTHMHKYIESHISLKYQVLHLPPLISTLLHTMILPLYWSGDHPLIFDAYFPGVTRAINVLRGCPRSQS